MKLYLLPEDDDKAKAVNAETLQKAEAIKNQRVQEILSGKLETVKASLEHPASTTTSSKKTARLSKKKKVGSDKTGKSVKGKESEVNEVVERLAAVGKVLETKSDSFTLVGSASMFFDCSIYGSVLTVIVNKLPLVSFSARNGSNDFVYLTFLSLDTFASFITANFFLLT